MTGLARLLLYLYPASFRRARGADFVEATRHRWRREARDAGAIVGSLRTARILLADTVVAAPAARRRRRSPVRPWSASGLAGDLRFALRLLRKSPGFTAVAVLSLAVGIGANATTYGIARYALLDPLPVERPEELWLVHWSGPEDLEVSQYNSSGGRDPATGQVIRSNVSYSGYRALRDAPFPGELCGFNFVRQLGVSVEGRPAASAAGLLLSGSCFDVVRPGLALGRGITADDDRPGATPVAVVTHGFWTRALGADPAVVGSTLRIDGTAFMLVGVTAPGFRGLSTGAGSFQPVADVMIPLTAQPLVWGREEGPWFGLLDRLWVRVLARLPAGVDPAGATDGLSAALRGSLAAAGLIRADDPVPVEVTLEPGMRGVDAVSSRADGPLRILGAVVVVVLLIACVNVAGLSLARGLSRRQEIAVRRALGAGRLRLARQLLVESLVLGLAGGTAGLLLAWWAKPVVDAMVSTAFGAASPDVPVDLRTAGLALSVSVTAAVLFGILPAVRLTGGRASGFLRQRSAAAPASRATPSATAGRVLLALQIGVSVPLVVGAGLLLRTVHDLGSVDVGFEPEDLVVFRVEPGSTVDEERRAALSGRLLERLEAIPGVESATLVENVLLSGWVSNNRAVIDGEERMIHMNAVGPRFFETMGIPVVAGRAVDGRDDAGAPPAVVINETAARRYFGDESPLGRRFRYGTTEAEVVGVARDSKYASVRGEVVPTLFDSYLQRANGWVSNIVLRTSAPLVGLERQIRDAVREVRPDLPVAGLRRQADVLERSIGRERLLTRLLGVFGAFALGLACIGLYGMTSYAVARSTGEIGIRKALGAERRDVVWLVLRQVLSTTGAGLLLGIPAALATSPVLESLLYGIGPRDVTTLGVAAGTMLAVGLVAGLLPARRAARLDPLVALRSE